MTKSRKYNQFLRFLSICGILILVVFVFSGCANQNQATQHESDSTKKEIHLQGEIQEVMGAAEDILGQMHFTIEKADYDIGYIRTRPLSGAQLFEFWRTENIGLKNNLLSNLHSIRRIVELNINKQQEQLDIDCEVRVQRLSMPQREITSSARAYQLFTRSSLYFQRLELNSEQEESMVWLNLDRDLELEAEILKRISLEVEEQREVSDLL